MRKFISHLPLQSWAFIALALFAAAPARADFVETFDNGSNDGDWHLTSDPSRLLQIEPGGGNPGPYLHGEVFNPVPTWYVPAGTTSTHFLGDYFASGVTSLGIDLNIFGGIQAPDRNLTLDLRTTLGTGDFGQGLEAYFIGADISILPVGWTSFDYAVDAASATIPAGWVLFHGDGTPGSDADWRLLMQHVETLGFELGRPGYAYPGFRGWDLGMDNARISEAVPEPNTLALSLVFGVLLAAGGAFHRRRVLATEKIS